MKIAIHQPEHLPWPGYFDKMKQVDLYVYLDNVQYRKNHFQNRNRISIGWLTVPVLTKGHTCSTIKDMRIDNTQKWQKKYMGRLDDRFRRCPDYGYYRAGLWSCVVKDYTYLVDLNYSLIELLRFHLDINTPTVRASDLKVKGSNSELLLNICRATGANAYLSGPSGRNYLNTEIFDGVELQYHDYPRDKMLSSVEYIINGN